IVVLMLVPASLWRHPADDASYSGFDSNLMYTSGGVAVSPNTLTLEPKPRSDAVAHLITTPISYTATFDVAVASESADSIPLRIEVWSPATNAGYRLVFSAAGDELREQTVTSAKDAMDLSGGVTGIDQNL